MLDVETTEMIHINWITKVQIGKIDMMLRNNIVKFTMHLLISTVKLSAFYWWFCAPTQTGRQHFTFFIVIHPF
jgi:hypothetical protein